MSPSPKDQSWTGYKTGCCVWPLVMANLALQINTTGNVSTNGPLNPGAAERVTTEYLNARRTINSTTGWLFLRAFTKVNVWWCSESTWFTNIIWSFETRNNVCLCVCLCVCVCVMFQNRWGVSYIYQTRANWSLRTNYPCEYVFLRSQQHTETHTQNIPQNTHTQHLHKTNHNTHTLLQNTYTHHPHKSQTQNTHTQHSHKTHTQNSHKTQHKTHIHNTHTKHSNKTQMLH